MKRTIWLVPVAAVLAAAGVTSVANATSAPLHHRVAVVAHKAAAPAPGSSAVDDRGIIAAIKASPMLGEVPASDISVRTIRVAGSGRSWASAAIHPIDQRTDDARVALHQTGGHWSVVTLGTAGVGCVVPKAVRADLALSCYPGK